MPRFKINHITRYTYVEPVRDSANRIMLYPVKDDFQELVRHNLIISGNPSVAVFTDYFGNEVGTFTHPHPHRELVIDSSMELITKPRPAMDDSAAAEEQWKILDRLGRQFQFIDFLRLEPFAALGELEQVIRQERGSRTTPLSVASDFSAYINKNFKYQKGITTVESTPDEIWSLRSGVCQDFAHILLCMLRLVRVPGRYVSGYICPNQKGMRGEGATHAWVEAYIPGQGWVGLDPTNNCIVNDSHVRLAVGKNFSDCSPVKGTYRGTSDHTLEVTVSVQYEDGHSIKNLTEVIEPPHETVQSISRNSYRKFQEMQMQQ
jgi:transglutaminase-like putative cysteine protease